MADQILKDATKLGSTLASFASSQLQTVLSELRGPLGEGTGQRDGDQPSLGALGATLLQILNQTGSLIVQLSQYDLVRNDANLLRLGSANPISSITLHVGQKTSYELLVENNGRKKLQLSIAATLHLDGRERALKPLALTVDASERRRVQLELDRLPAGKATLAIVAYADKDDRPARPQAKTRARRQAAAPAREAVARKTVAINVLPAPGLHEP